MKHAPGVVAYLFCVLGTMSLSGATIGIADFSGSEEVITFDPGTGPAYPGSIPGPFVVSTASTNVRFSSFASNTDLGAKGDFGAYAVTPGVSQGNALNDRVTREPSNLRVDFDDPVARFGVWVNGGNASTSWLVSTLDDQNDVIESALFNYGGTGYPRLTTFVGFESTTPITAVTIVEQMANNQFTSLNDVRFELIPEPSTLALLAMGAFGLLAYGWRRRKA